MNINPWQVNKYHNESGDLPDKKDIFPCLGIPLIDI